VTRPATIAAAALPLLLFVTAPAVAQDAAAPEAAAPEPNLIEPPASELGNPANNPPEAGLGDDEVGFSSATLEYDQEGDIVTATGDVRMIRQGNRLRAEKVVWDRKSGAVTASGNVAVTTPEGDTAYGDHVALEDTLKDGVIENMLLVLADGGRLAAVKATRVNDVSTLDHAAYTPCSVTGENGCPKEPLWQITAVRVVHDPARHRISYRDARLTLLGLPILWLPGLSHPDGSGGGGSGLLVPDGRYRSDIGLELELPYYLQLAPNRDLTITPHIFTNVLPALEAEYRELNSLGAYRMGGFITKGSRLPVDPDAPPIRKNEIRAYLYGNGTYQLTPEWSVTGALRYATDRSMLRRYDISYDDRLRSMVQAERITPNSYVSIAGYAVQSMRFSADPGQQPIALPAVDYRRRLDGPLLGGKIELQANSLSIIRTEGQDTQRAFAGARWDVRRLTDFGQELTFTAYARADVYHTDDILATVTPSYRGRSGWTGRAIGAFAADMRWPLVGEFLGGTQRITPRVQIVASPPTANLRVPNEDARAVDLEDSNLFALNRFSGYDRWEDGNRATWGMEYALDLPSFSLRSIIGQSYRLNDKPGIFPIGTGLSERFSDIVGRSTIKYGRFLSLTHRFRADKDNLALRRNEIDATVGSTGTYATVGYLRLNRDITDNIEDLRDREEIRIGARAKITRHWSVFGSSVIDLTSASEDPASIADGYEPVRQRFGVAYEDECLEFGLTWRRDYDPTGDSGRGNSFLFRLAFKNLGR